MQNLHTFLGWDDVLERCSYYDRCVILIRFHWNRSDEMMMIVLEAQAAHKKAWDMQRLDVEIPRKNDPKFNCLHCCSFLMTLARYT